MKNLSVGLIFSLFIAYLLPSALLAQEEASQESEVTNPFFQGVRLGPLDEEDKKTLSEYINQSSMLLKDALEEAKGRSFDEANEIYHSAIIQVILASYEEDRRSELLMRYALAQALELTYGVPSADGQRLVSQGLLNGSAHKELATSILEDSISLALEYMREDQKSVGIGDLVHLPYDKFAGARLDKAQMWLASIFDWKIAYRFSVAIVEHWFATMGAKANLDRNAYAEILWKVDREKAAFSSNRNFDKADEIIGEVRKLRKLIRQIHEAMPETRRAKSSGNVKGTSSRSFTRNEIDEAVSNAISYSKRISSAGESNAMIYRIFLQYRDQMDIKQLKELIGALRVLRGQYYQDDFYDNGRTKRLRAITQEYFAAHSRKMEETDFWTFIILSESTEGDKNGLVETYFLLHIGRYDKEADLDRFIRSLRSIRGRYYEDSYYEDGRKKTSDRMVKAWFSHHTGVIRTKR